MSPRFLSYRDRTGPCYGLAVETGIINLSRNVGSEFPTLREVVAAGRLKALAETASGRKADTPFSAITFEIPVPSPEKIICVGVNYPDRNEEYKDGQQAPQNPSLFVRFPRSFVGHEQALIRPSVSTQLDYEGEIVLIIGKQGHRIDEREALGHVAALSLCNEGSVRDWIRHGKFNVTQGKNFDRSGSLGPWLIPFEGEQQIGNIRLSTRVNGNLRQDDRTSRMIFGFRKLLSYISTFTTLVPGDMIVTGTPTGAGARLEPPSWLTPGDVVEVEAEGLGVLRNTIADEGVA